jgi:hypothetical protein
MLDPEVNVSIVREADGIVSYTDIYNIKNFVTSNKMIFIYPYQPGNFIDRKISYFLYEFIKTAKIPMYTKIDKTFMPYSEWLRGYIRDNKYFTNKMPLFDLLAGLFGIAITVRPEIFKESLHNININNDKNFIGLMDTLNLIAYQYNFPIIFSTHPRTRKMIEQKQLKMNPLINFLKPMGFNDYNFLQINSFAVLSDSGTIGEESSIFNFRALNIREAHERPEAMEEASVMMVGLKSERILQALEQVSLQSRGKKRTFRLVEDYSNPNVSDKVVRIIISYVDYIKSVVWREF